jgi:hypothetical protein
MSARFWHTARERRHPHFCVFKGRFVSVVAAFEPTVTLAQSSNGKIEDYLGV